MLIKSSRPPGLGAATLAGPRRICRAGVRPRGLRRFDFGTVTNDLAEAAGSAIMKWANGRVAEWLKAPDSKSGVGVTLPEVRILSLPPAFCLDLIGEGDLCTRPSDGTLLRVWNAVDVFSALRVVANEVRACW